MQLFWYGVILLGAVVGAFGVFGSSIYKDRSAQRDKAAQQKTINDLTAQVAKFEAALNKNTEVILASQLVKPDDKWSVELKNIPTSVADYALLLFRSDRGRITGKVRLAGSNTETLFSTAANDKLPIAVPNVWETNSYRSPAVLEYAITSTTDPSAHLSILTAGWIDFRGQQPHLKGLGLSPRPPWTMICRAVSKAI